MIKALVFDMDGVIVDSEPLHLKAYQEFFSAYGIGYKQEENQQFLGCKDIAIADILIERYNLPLEPKELVETKENILCRLLRSDAKPRPGLKRILQEAADLKVPMAVASSATMPAIELVMEVLQVRNYFHHLSSGDEVANGKPAPDVFLLAAKRLGVQPGDCLVIEDTLNGIKAAKAAGMHCLSIPCAETKHQDHSLADMHLSSLEELDLKTLLV